MWLQSRTVNGANMIFFETMKKTYAGLTQNRVYIKG